MFDVDDFVSRCQTAIAETESRRAIKEILTRAMSAPREVADALAPTEGGITFLHRDDVLTVAHVVWAPGMKLRPHNHNMWAAIGIYAGAEDNEFFRRTGPGEKTIVESGGKRLDVTDVVLLGDDTIHAVSNPSAGLTGAIHIYPGDFVSRPRSQWGPGERTERPYAMDDTYQQFADANAVWRATAG